MYFCAQVQTENNLNDRIWGIESATQKLKVELAVINISWNQL